MIDCSGEYWHGDEADDINDYLKAYSGADISAHSKGMRTEYVTDITGSVIAEVSSKFLNTEVTTKAYTPFGETESSGFGFKGEYYNADTGMIYLRARFYTPGMNRFSQKDSVRGTVIMPESLNRYVYCANDPVNLIDPSGRTWSSAVQKLKNVGSNIASSFKANPVKTVVAGAAAVATAITHPIATAVAATVAVGSFVAEVCKPAQPATPPAPQPGPPPVPNPNPGPQYSDGGNNQREQTIYHSTYTPTPSYTPTYQTPAVTQPAQQVCNGGKGTVLQIIINKLKDSSNATKQSVSEKFNENTIHIYKEGEGEDDPNKFNIRITSNDVYNNIQIPDSRFVKSNAERSAVLDVIMSSEYYSEEKYGTKEHMMAQWQAHNAAYVVANGMNAIGELTNTENFMEKVYPYIFGGATNPIKSAETLDIREIGNTNSR